MRLLSKLIFIFILVSFSSFSQEADSLSKDFVSEGFKIHGYVMNITDIAKINTIRKPMFLGVNGVQLTTFTKENNWWKNGMFSVYVLNSYGDNPTTDYLGDYQMFDSLLNNQSLDYLRMNSKHIQRTSHFSTSYFLW